MAQDIVPELNESIQSSFKTNCLRDRRLTTISKRIRDGTATLADGHDYAEHLGENLSKALISNLTKERLPNGILYYNIATRTVTPALMENYELINEVSAEIQKGIDEAAKIGLGSVKADFPTSRINGLIDKMTSDNPLITQVVMWLAEPIINNSEAFFDDYVDENAKFRKEAGLKATLTRTAAWNCCEWCAALEGTYDYDNAPADIYRRHEFCRCTVTFKSEKTSQNVWSKRKWQTDPQDLERRKSQGISQSPSAEERLSQLEQFERDQAISDYMKQTGYSRRTARASTLRKDPAEIQAEIKKIKERQQSLRR